MSSIPPCSLVVVDAEKAVLCTVSFHLSPDSIASLTEHHTLIVLDPVRVTVRVPSVEPAAHDEKTGTAVVGPPASGGVVASSLSYECVYPDVAEHLLVDGRPAVLKPRS
jgi:hypothetical protein